MADSGILSIRDIETSLIKKAYTDDAFAAKLKSDPKGMLQEELAKAGVGVSLPDDLNVIFVEESVSQLYLVMPAKSPKASGGQLSDQQLELVSGGGYRDVFNTCCAASGTVGEPNWCG
jgi:hypothetical protein